MRRLPVTIAAALTASIVLAGCSASTSPNDGGAAAADGPEALNIGNFLDITSWDPALADIGFDGPYLSAVYDSLIALDADGKPVPSLATKWTVADDDLSIELDIRTDAKFSDGTAVDVDAVIASLEYLKEGPRSGEAYTRVSSFSKVDDDTV